VIMIIYFAVCVMVAWDGTGMASRSQIFGWRSVNLSHLSSIAHKLDSFLEKETMNC